MGALRNTQTLYANGAPHFPPNSVISNAHGRNLDKIQLGGVIFGCKNSTMKECLSKQLFGLPAQHFSYVKNIDPGLPLFLFNYSDRKIHGIFEASSKGHMYIDPYAWSVDCSEKTQYPAQVKIRIRLQCQPLHEDKFRQVIGDNYYIHNHFWFELDHRQASKLMSLLVSLAIAPATPSPAKWRIVTRPIPSCETPKECEPFEMIDSETEHFSGSSATDSSEMTSSFDGDIKPLDSHKLVKEVKPDEKNLIFMKLKQLALRRQSQELSKRDNVKDIAGENNMCYVQKSHLKVPTVLEKKDHESSSPPLKYQYSIAKLMQEVEELTDFKKTHTQKNCLLEQKLKEATLEIKHLKDRCSMLESANDLPSAHVEKTVIQPSVELHLDPKESLFLIGGFDGESWLSSMDLFCPSRNVIKPLKPMSSVRSYCSVVQLNGELYVFGGGNGDVWYDTVESYSPVRNEWTLCPPLKQKKGSLAGASLNNKIFVVGGGNGFDCFSDVEMLDLNIGRWISTRSMLDKRFALAAAELNGVLYATGGFNGDDYLKCAERFDPREHSWMKIPDMNTKRGCHSMVVLNEKLYAIGGFDGSTMVTSIDVFDPRLGAWMMGEPMNHRRGYFATAVVNESIYVIGGVKIAETIEKTVESYKEGEGWQETCISTVGQRCFLTAITL